MSLLSAGNSAAALAAISNTHGIAEFSTDGIILSANENFLAPLGYRLDELVGRHHSVLVDPSQRDGAACRAFWAKMQEGQHEAAEFKRIGRDGGAVWFQASYNPVLDPDGRVIKIIKIATDVTGRRREVDVQRGIVNALHEVTAIAEFSLGGKIITANDKFLAIFGYSLAELQGQPHEMLVPPEERGMPKYRAFWNAIRRGRHENAQFRRVARDGAEIWLRASYIPVLDDSDKPLKIVKFAADITREKRQAVDQFQKLQAISRSQAIIEFNLDGTILTANRQFLNMFGYTLDEIQGRDHAIFVTEATRDSAVYRAFWERLRAGRYETAEFKRLGKDGREIWLQASYNPILDFGGKPLRVIKVAADVSEQKRATAEYVSQMAAIHRTHMVAEYDLDGHFLSANENFLNRTGYTLDAIKGQHHSLLMDPADRQTASYAGIWKKLRRGELVSGEFYRRTSDLRDMWVQVTYSPIMDAEGQPCRIVGFAFDVTAQRLAAANQLAQIETIHRSHAAAEYTADGKFITANEKFLQLCGYTLPEIIGAHYSMMVPAEVPEQQALGGLWADLAGGQHQAGEYRGIGKNGQEFVIRGSFTPNVNDRGKVTKIVFFGVDITDERQKAAAAQRDSLTGLPNRMLMDDRLAQAITLARRQQTILGLMFLDLDGFKQINDTHGHAAGDKLLQSVARRLTDRLRQSDTVSRRGGDEFLILLPNLRAREDAGLIAASLLDVIGKPYVIGGLDLRVTTSIGIALFPDDAEDADGLIEQADLAMYQAKQTGRNAFAFARSSIHQDN